MKNKFLYLFFGVFIFLVFACKKESVIKTDDTKVPEVSYPTYMQLETGNYWVYERFNIDTNGQATALGIFDSCYVEKDTTINGKIYHKYVKPYFSTSLMIISFVRDSLHYIVNHEGGIIFSSEDFTTVFGSNYYLVGSDTMYYVIKQMADKSFQVSTPAGEYITSNARQTYIMYPGWDNHGNPRYMHTRYAKDIGVVIETLPFFSNNPNYTEKRLVRYSVTQ